MAALGVTVALVQLVSGARAGTITQNASFTLNTDAPASVVHFTPFDLSLGTLQNITVTYTATRRHDWGLWNTDSDLPVRDIHYDASLIGTTLSLGGTSFSFPDLYYGPSDIFGLPAVSFSTAVGEFFSGQSQFLAGATPVFPSAFQPVGNSSTIGGQLSLPSFDGDLVFSFDPGLLNVAYFDGVWTLNADNVFAGSLVDLSGTATLTYTYTPTAVVGEPSPGIWPAIVWIAVLLVQRSGRQRRNPV